MFEPIARLGLFDYGAIALIISLCVYFQMLIAHASFRRPRRRVVATLANIALGLFAIGAILL